MALLSVSPRLEDSSSFCFFLSSLMAAGVRLHLASQRTCDYGQSLSGFHVPCTPQP